MIVRPLLQFAIRAMAWQSLPRLTVTGLALTGALVMSPLAGHAEQKWETMDAQRIADHFSSVKTMAGEFIQFGPQGQQIGGEFFLDRPGKIRFNYEDPSPIRVISDGRSVVIGNQKLKTWDVYPLSATPLNLLLSERIDLTGSMVKEVREEPDLITIILGDKTLFGDSTITMMFDPLDYGLRQWTITDAQGRDTSVMIFNVQTGLQFSRQVFEIPYDEIRKRSTLR